MMNEMGRPKWHGSVLKKVRNEVKITLAKDSTGHDYWHCMRVARVARQIALEEGANAFICELAAWTHDACRPLEKETGMPHAGKDALVHIRHILESSGVEESSIQPILKCVAEHENYSFLGDSPSADLESRVLQDADRIDAIGAIGIARAFMFAGAHGQPMGGPDLKGSGWSPGNYSNTAIGHFHDKLLRLAGEMHTPTGKVLAQERKRVVEEFVDQFMKEWEGDLL